MRDRVGALVRLVQARLVGESGRASWSFIDQILISAVNVVTTILLVRALGLYEFGVYSMVIIGVQFLASFQSAGILAPMMSLFDQRGGVSQSSYLAAILLHQVVYAAVMIVVLMLASILFANFLTLSTPIDFALVAALSISTQFQDLVRRFFYVTDRPVRAFLSDLVAYGVRLVLIAALALAGYLTIGLVWAVMIGTSAAALLFIFPELVRLDVSWPAIKNVTESHKRTAGWMVGSSFVGWFSESGFAFLLIGSVLGSVQLGGARAILNVVHVVNLLLQSLENFVPSAATRALLQGGGGSLLRYITNISLLGAVGISAVIALLMIFADPIMMLVYEQTFPDQLAILAVLGAYHVFGHVTMVITAGLRALEFMRAVFFAQVMIGAFAVALLWHCAQVWGVVGALSGLLFVRMLVTGRLAWLLRWRAMQVSSEPAVMKRP